MLKFVSLLKRQRAPNKYHQILRDDNGIPGKFENEKIIACEGFSTEEVNLFINNLISPQESDSPNRRKLNIKEEEIKSNRAYLGRERLAHLQTNGTITENSGKQYATFEKLKRRLDNIKSFYPNLYYADESIIDMWGSGKELFQNIILEYDPSNSDYLWI